MSFFVYILRCADGSYYTGHTDNLEHRIAQHNDGTLVGYTSQRRPVELAYFQTLSTREEAFTCERQIKGWSRRKKEALMRQDWEALSRHSRSRNILRQAQDERFDKLRIHQINWRKTGEIAANRSG